MPNLGFARQASVDAPKHMPPTSVGCPCLSPHPVSLICTINLVTMAFLRKFVIPSQYVIRPGVKAICKHGQRRAKYAFQQSAAALDAAELEDYADRSATSSVSSDTYTAVPQEQQLVDWIKLHGGFVHPSLIIVDNAPCGCRGLVASQDICAPLPPNQHSLGSHQMAVDLQQNGSVSSDGHNQLGSELSAACGPHLVPVIAVPEELYMTADDAVQILTEVILQKQQHIDTSSRISNNGTGFVSHLMRKLVQLPQQLLNQRQQLAEPLTRLQPPLLLALLLAHERNKGIGSRWYPYIAALPVEPPCGWFRILQQQQQQGLDRSLNQQQVLLEQHRVISPESLAAAAAAVQAKCTAAAQTFGPVLGVTVEDIVWAFGQVVSRAFGSGSDVGLAPLIDMTNHKQRAPTPQLLTVPLATRGVEAISPAQQQTRVAVAGHHPSHARPMDSLQDSHGSAVEKLLWAVCVAPQGNKQQQQQVALAAGQELYISYIASCDAATAYLNFGFVPPEKLC